MLAAKKRTQPTKESFGAAAKTRSDQETQDQELASQPEDLLPVLTLSRVREPIPLCSSAQPSANESAHCSLIMTNASSNRRNSCGTRSSAHKVVKKVERWEEPENTTSWKTNHQNFVRLNGFSFRIVSCACFAGLCDGWCVGFQGFALTTFAGRLI